MVRKITTLDKLSVQTSVIDALKREGVPKIDNPIETRRKDTLDNIAIK